MTILGTFPPTVKTAAHDAAVNAAWIQYVGALRDFNRLRRVDLLCPQVRRDDRALLAAETLAAQLYVAAKEAELARLDARLAGAR